MALVVAVLGLALLSMVVSFAARWRSSERLGPLSRKQVAARLIVFAVVVALGWLIFPVLWWGFFGYGCCNP